jgi:adenine-specific DNA methylase
MVWIVALRKTLPKGSAVRRAALAALIQAASQCIASPGHTAQPFQPTRSAKKFLLEAWSKDIVQATKRNLEEIAKVASRKKGAARKLDANATARKLKDTDLVFVDPPYSGVHYSRFYHVLESLPSIVAVKFPVLEDIQHGTCGRVPNTVFRLRRKKRWTTY